MERGAAAGRLMAVRSTGAGRRSAAGGGTAARPREAAIVISTPASTPPTTHAAATVIVEGVTRRTGCAEASSPPLLIPIPTALQARMRRRVRSESDRRECVRGSGGRWARVPAGDHSGATPSRAAPRARSRSPRRLASCHERHASPSAFRTTPPSANRSVRASSVKPRTCSGAM